MSKHFLCCIPVRVAVFVSSLLSFLFAGAVAGGAWFLLIRALLSFGAVSLVC